MNILSGYHNEFINDYMNYKNSIKVLDPATIVQRLRRIPQPEQRSDAWFALRKEMITASSAATLIPKKKKYMKEYLEQYNLYDSFKDDPSKGFNPYSNRREFFLDKCGHRTFFGNEATRHGQKFEDVACAIYSRHINEHIYEFGLIPHPILHYIGASPDGISESGIMLEIKVPMRRKITGIVPVVYWVQVQLQLEVCNLEICDFVECKLLDYENEEEWQNDTVAEQKGLILRIGEDKYAYPPVHMTAPEDLLVWANEYATNSSEGVETVHKVYWKLEQICITRIHRSREWFRRIRPIFYASHLELKWHQRNGAKELLKEKEIARKTLDLRPYMLESTTVKSMISATGFTDSEDSEDSESEGEMDLVQESF